MTKREEEIIQAIKDGYTTVSEIKKRLKMYNRPVLTYMIRKGLIEKDGEKEVEVNNNFHGNRKMKVAKYKISA